MENIVFYENIIQEDFFPIRFIEDSPGFNESESYLLHWHESFEVIFIKQGEAFLFYRGNKILLKPGDLVVIDINELHSYIIGKCIYDGFLIDKTFFDKTDILISDLHFKPKITDPEIINKFINILKLKNIDDLYRVISVNSNVFDFIITLCRKHLDYNDNSNESADGKQDYIKKTIKYIKLNYGSNFSIDDICKEVGLSKYYLCHMFKSTTGNSIIEYTNKFRCNIARTLLESNLYSVKEVAFMCGFNSVSYFSRAYKLIIGELPSTKRSKL